MGRRKKQENLDVQAESGNDDFYGIDEENMVIETMDAQRLDWNIGTLYEKMASNEINFDAPVQRGYVWANKKDSLLIRSILRRVPISNFYFNKINGMFEGLEGKQRSNAIYRFIQGRYKLNARTLPIKIGENVYPIAKKSFADLPLTLRNRIMSYPIDGHYFDNMTIDEKVDFFVLTNSGKPVTAAEISRIRIKSRDVFIKLAEHQAIASNMSEKNKGKCIDEDVVSQLWCMCYNEETTSLLQKDIGPVLAAREVTQQQKNDMMITLDYLQAFYQSVWNDNKFNKTKTKNHMISLAYMAYLAMQRNMTMDEYVEKAKSFFSGDGRKATNNPAYNASIGVGSSKPEQVRIRKEEIEKALN